MPETTPAETLRKAAALMREKAEAASLGPWHEMCLGSEGCMVLNNGRLRERKHVSFSGRKEWKADHADAEFIASMHPLIGLALADLLDDSAAYYEGLSADEADFVAAALGGDVDPGLKLARLVLGEGSNA